ncbi:uncharacterized protein KY384_001580 [Bacidia gigantensis]|uniref:uncharacterized protein n=1 Tax=Bacidia gigantensis TaxID=2732470 RepID=UPI001D042717|nr:uncharacterized protein KY384_001580 [Bacidia gigantensis]KAG8533839.1 hypothetical protein KY384_001580 [Bacidia gigantensis]
MLSSPRQLPYAPTPYSYTPNTALSATINLDQEVKLSEASADRDVRDSLAEIYSIIITLDGLEKAYIRDSIPEVEYTELCNRLLKQYKSNLSDEKVAKEFVDLETFKREWDIECPRATERLRVNLPSTITDASPRPSTPSRTPHHQQQTFHAPTSGSSGSASGQQILTATENFITLLDALKLGLLSKDALHPLLAELIQSVNAVTTQEFEGRAKIIAWLIRLNQLKAQDHLSEEEARELGFEMEGAYRGFKGTLS